MMRIIDMTDAFFDDDDEDSDYHFAVYNTATCKFLVDDYSDQVWTKDEWEETDFHDAVKHRIRMLWPGYQLEESDTPRCRDCGLPKTPINGGKKGYKCIDCYWE